MASPLRSVRPPGGRQPPSGLPTTRVAAAVLLRARAARRVDSPRGGPVGSRAVGRPRSGAAATLASSDFSNFYSGDKRWGGWGSNSRPADYEKSGPALRALCLHTCHGVVPLMALIALFAPMARSTNRSTPDHDGHPMPATERYRLPADREAAEVVQAAYLEIANLARMDVASLHYRLPKSYAIRSYR